MIKDLAYEIDKNIRMKYGNEAQYCKAKGRTKQATNKTLNRLKRGEGANILNVIKILNDLNLKIKLIPQEE